LNNSKNYESLTDLELKRNLEDLESEMNKREILNNHNAAISYNANKDYYYTYLRIDGKRKSVTRKSRADLENYLIQYYQINIGGKTFKDYYNEWITQLERCDANLSDLTCDKSF